jgi:outer membrane receptor protein involved in Fe transport
MEKSPPMKSKIILVSVFSLSFLNTSNASENTPSTSKDFETVVVKDQVQAVQNLIDKKVYSIADQIQNSTGNAADALRSIPSVEVSGEGELTLRGDPNVTILIDGRPSSRLTGSRSGDGLLNIPASNIEKVEVMLQPGAQYGSEGSAGVINIITKKNLHNESTSNLFASLGQQNRFLLGSTTEFGSEVAKDTLGITIRQDVRHRVVTSTSHTLGEGSIASVYGFQTDELISRLIPSFKNDIDINVSTTSTLHLNLELTGREGRRNFNQTSSYSSMVNTGITQTSENDLRQSFGHEHEFSWERNLAYEKKLNPNLDLEVYLRGSSQSEHENYFYKNFSPWPGPLSSIDNLHLNQDIATNELGVNFSYKEVMGEKWKWGWSKKWDHNHFYNTGDNVDIVSGLIFPNDIVASNYLYTSQINSLYASRQLSFDRWNFMMGARYETTTSKNSLPTTPVNSHHLYSGIYPNLNAVYEFSEVDSFNFSLGRRLSRPQAEWLNPFVDHQDIFNLRSGNANLLPQTTDSFSIGYSQEANKTIQGLTAYYKINHNSVTDIVSEISPGINLFTKQNLPISHFSGIEFNRSNALTDDLNYKTSGNLFASQIDARSLGATGLKSYVGLNLKSSIEWRPALTHLIQVSINHEDKKLTPQGYLSPINLVNLGYRHLLTNHSSVFVTVSDVFNQQRLIRETESSGFSQVYQRHLIGPVVFLGLNFQLTPDQSGAIKDVTKFDYLKGETP